MVKTIFTLGKVVDDAMEHRAGVVDPLGEGSGNPSVGTGGSS